MEVIITKFSKKIKSIAVPIGALACIGLLLMRYANFSLGDVLFMYGFGFFLLASARIIVVYFEKKHGY
jgi:hypothetical protein